MSTEAPDDGRRKKRPGIEQQKNSIIKAATALFSEHGSKAVSISQICLLADITRPTFYRCFEDKDALLEELYQSAVSKAVDDMLQQNPFTAANAIQIKIAIEQVYETIFKQAKLADLLFREASDPNSPAYSIINNAFERISMALLEALHIEQDTGQQSTGHHKVYLKALMAANQWIVHDAIIKGLSEEDKQQAKQASWMMTKKLFSLEDSAH
jgi:AcrR family transcriptional regulator